VIERSGEEGSEWLTPPLGDWEGLIQAGKSETEELFHALTFNIVT